MKKKIWYTGNNVQFFDSEPKGQQGNVHNFTVDTDNGEITGLNLGQSERGQQRQAEPSSAS
jgi:hypothetical protein